MNYSQCITWTPMSNNLSKQLRDYNTLTFFNPDMTLRPDFMTKSSQVTICPKQSSFLVFKVFTHEMSYWT